MKNKIVIISAACILSILPPAIGDLSTVKMDEYAVIQLRQAIDLLDRGRFADAERKATAFIEAAEPAGSKALLIRAKARQLQQKYEQASQDYAAFLTKNPSTSIRGYVEDQISQCLSCTPSLQVSPLKKPMPEQKVRELSQVRGQDEIFQTLNFIARSGNRELSRLIAQQAEYELAKVCKDIYPSLKLKRKIVLEIYPNHAAYLVAVGQQGAWSQGLSIYNPSGKTAGTVYLVQNDSSGQLDVASLSAVIPHEISHIATAEFFASLPSSSQCPLFLDEGLAAISQGGSHDDLIRLASTAMSGGAGIPLSQLLQMQQVPDDQRQLFYAQSFSLTDFLRARLSAEQFSKFLGNIRGGMTFYKSLAAALCLPDESSIVGPLEDAWKDFAATQMQLSRILNVVRRENGDGEQPADSSVKKL